MVDDRARLVDAKCHQFIPIPRHRRAAGSRTIYIVLLGDFSPEQKSVLAITQEYLSVFFQTPVKVLRELPLDIIPDDARRVHPEWGTRQVSSRYVLDELLKPERPDDALAYLCFTSSDLFSNATHNFVLGEAQTWERLGVWSIYRNGDPAESEEAFRQCLRRTMHIATHETGHILGMHHCVFHECNMNGSNHLDEALRTPTTLCPMCLRKLCWNLQVEPAAYVKKLEAFCEKHGMAEDAKAYRRAWELLGAK